MPATDHYPDGDQPSDEDLLATLADAVRVLEDADVDYALVGGIGTYALARPRGTDDVDVFVRPDEVPKILERLADAGFDVQEHDPAWLAKAWKRGVLVDVVFQSTGNVYLDDEMIRRRQQVEYKGATGWALAPEDLLVMKALATTEHTAHHWWDAIGLVARCEIDWDYLVRRSLEAGARRMLSFLLFAESCDLVVPADRIRQIFDAVHPLETPA